MTNEAVERVARAIVDGSDAPGQAGWDECAEGYREYARRKARAAIAALQDPTEAMLRAGQEAMPPDGTRDWSQTAIAVWRAMIDAALAGETY